MVLSLSPADIKCFIIENYSLSYGYSEGQRLLFLPSSMRMCVLFIPPKDFFFTVEFITRTSLILISSEKVRDRSSYEGNGS